MQPQVVLAFANRTEGKPGFLRSLRREQREIEAALDAAQARFICEVDSRSDVTRDGLVDHLQTAEAADFTVVFHYGGHASGSALALRAGDVPAQGVAALLSKLPRLHLVFLNGCSTQAQVDALLDMDVPVVVATRADVKDAAATDFATHFYQRLGDGSTIREAFDDAVVAVQTKHTVFTVSRAPSTGSTRFTPKAPPPDPGVPWQLYSRGAPEPSDPLAWSLPQVAQDPLFVLPHPPASPLAEPFRGAEPYRVQDAEIFRGRGAEIRAAFDALTAGTSAVVVLHGPAGVGRTSMVHAGLLSRLQIDHGALAVVPETLDDVDGAGPEVLLIDEAERLSEAQIRRALEMSPRVLFAVMSAARAALTATITAAGHAVVPLRLDHLDEGSIERVIREITRLFPFRYSPNLPERLAVDLAGHGAAAAVAYDGSGLDAASTQRAAAVVGATTPITSAVLHALWSARTDDEVRDEQYEAFKRDGHLDTFVRDGLQALAAENSEWVNSGFALDLLAHHRTLLGKLRGHTIDALKSRYAHREDVQAFVEAACVHRLLVQTPDGAGTLLAHDLLAPLIGSRFAHSRAPAQQARRIIEERLPGWANGREGATLDASDLLTIESGRLGMPVLNADGLRMTEASARAVVAKARRRRILRSALAGAAILALTLAFLWNQRRIEVQHTKAEAKQLIDARDLAAGLVEAYRKLEDPTPQRAAAGVRQLGTLVHANPAMAPDVARLALRAWSMVLADPRASAARAARPNVIGRGAQSWWVDLSGRSHPLESPPDHWFVLPTGNTLAIHSEADKRLRTYDARTGALIGSHVLPRITSIVQLAQPGQVVVVQDLQALDEATRLLILDGKSGAGQSLRIDGGWAGDCEARIHARPEVDGVAAPHEQARWFAFEFDASGALKALPPSDFDAQTRLEDCVRKVVPAQAPAADGAGLIEPAWRRWRSTKVSEDELGAALPGRAGTAPPPPTGDDFWPPGKGCEPGCYHLGRAALQFATAQGPVLAGVSGCTDAMHSDQVVRACLGAKTVTAPVTADAVDPDKIEDVLAGARRRGDFMLLAGHLLRLSDFTWASLEVAGTARDFALSPSGKRLLVMTDTRMLVFEIGADGRFSGQGAVAADAAQGAVLRAQFLDEDRVVLQRATDVLAMRLSTQTVLWRRSQHWHPTDCDNAGLAVGSSVGADLEVVVVRRGDRVRILAAMDGTPLAPIEPVDGLSKTGPVTIGITPDGGVRVRDGDTGFDRTPLPSTLDTAAFMTRVSAPPSTDALPAVRAKVGLEDSGPRCPPNAILKHGECWPSDAQTPTPTPQTCAAGGPDMTFLHRVIEHLVTECVPEPGRSTHGCGVLDTFNANQPGGSLYRPQSATRLKLLLRIRRVRHVAVDQATAWITRCRPQTLPRLRVALAHLGRALTVYDEPTFKACEAQCGGFKPSAAGDVPALTPQSRESDTCVRTCWATKARADVGGMRGMLRFIHTRGPKGVSADDLQEALDRARAALAPR